MPENNEPQPGFIKNPVINCPYTEPEKHYRAKGGQIVDELVPTRRPSSYFVPIPQARRTGEQQTLEQEIDQELVEIETINRLRRMVREWASPMNPKRYDGTTATTRRLLEHWTDNQNRETKMFFCQREAVETAIFLAEAPSAGSRKLKDELRRLKQELVEENRAYSPNLSRLALKMATGSGKTVVMAMLIAWQTLNHEANKRSPKFTNRFLVITPGITIRDRLQVLHPSDPNNYYQQFDLVPPDLFHKLNQARIAVTNFHALQRRSRQKGVSRLARDMLEEEAYMESWGEMAVRVCRDLHRVQDRGKRKIMVINDEAHHCYRRRLEPETTTEDETETDKTATPIDQQRFDRDERREREAQETEARVWLTGLEKIDETFGISTVYDLSATPFFLAGSGEKEGTLFPWVVSDFSLMDAIECGIVKIPQVPIADSTSEYVVSPLTNRHLWSKIKDELPRGTRVDKTPYLTTKPLLPAALEGALKTLYRNYARTYEKWEQIQKERDRDDTPPVFIVVCSNTKVSKLVYDWVSGYRLKMENQTQTNPHTSSPTNSSQSEGEADRTEPEWAIGSPDNSPDRAVVVGSCPPPPPPGVSVSDQESDFSKTGNPGSADSSPLTNQPGRYYQDEEGTLLQNVPGNLSHFSNVDRDGNWITRPNTILIDSKQLESDEALSNDFLNAAQTEIAEFKRGIKDRNGDPDKIDTKDLLREVMNTVGKPGKLGEQIKCVISVSMLTEGWDAKTVTHILGVRAFSTQLLCEQVVGRALRRRSYTSEENSCLLPPNYAVVFGVPFAFIHTNPSPEPPISPTPVTHVRTLEERFEHEIWFPIITGYHYSMPDHLPPIHFDGDNQLWNTVDDIPTWTKVVGTIGPEAFLDLPKQRRQQTEFEMTKRLCDKLDKTWLFPDLLLIVRRWIDTYAIDNRAMSNGKITNEMGHHPLSLLQFDQLQDLAVRDIYRALEKHLKQTEQIKPRWDSANELGNTRGVSFETSRECYETTSKCHLSHVVKDSEWEENLARQLEKMGEVRSYAKVDQLGFNLPYTYRGRTHRYYPDFIARIDDGHGEKDLLNLVIEVTGESLENKKAKVHTAEHLWVPAVNNEGRWGRWGFIEIKDIGSAEGDIRRYFSNPPGSSGPNPHRGFGGMANSYICTDDCLGLLG